MAGRHGGDLVDHVHTVGHLAEDGVAEVARAVVEERVVGQVDEELGRGAVDDLGAGHGSGCRAGWCARSRLRS